MEVAAVFSMFSLLRNLEGNELPFIRLHPFLVEKQK
jgi:hypothetical protein